MPARQPFTHLCQIAAGVRSESHRADLHLHTSASDGVWPPEEIVRRARVRGLGAIAITDHDTIDGVAPALAAARVGSAIDVISGVEITCTYQERELHLLGYFFRTADEGLLSALRALQSARRQRFWDMLDRLRTNGIHIDQAQAQATASTHHSLGRQALAALLVQHGQAPTAQQAFMRHLRDGGPVALPKQALPVEEAIALVHQASGITSWAHPPRDGSLEQVRALADRGLDAIEAVYPAFTEKRTRQLREWAAVCGLAVSGGSDCHGPSPVRRAVGAYAVSQSDLEALRRRVPHTPAQVSR